jgi:hypothetical protein
MTPLVHATFGLNTGILSPFQWTMKAAKNATVKNGARAGRRINQSVHFSIRYGQIYRKRRLKLILVEAPELKTSERLYCWLRSTGTSMYNSDNNYYSTTPIIIIINSRKLENATAFVNIIVTTLLANKFFLMKSNFLLLGLCNAVWWRRLVVEEFTLD